MVLNGSRTCLAETCIVAAIGLLTLYLVMKFKESSKVRVKVSPGWLRPLRHHFSFDKQTPICSPFYLSHIFMNPVRPRVPWLMEWLNHFLSIFTITWKYFFNEIPFQNKAHYAARIKVAQRERDESLDWARNEAAQISDDERKQIEAMDFRTLRGLISTLSLTRTLSVRLL